MPDAGQISRAEDQVQITNLNRAGCQSARGLPEWQNIYSAVKVCG